MKFILCLATFFISSIYLPNASASESLSIFAGTGLDHTQLTYGNGEAPRFRRGFIMGAEYAYHFQNSPFSLTGSGFSNDTGLIGAGFETTVVLISGKVGVGLTNSAPNTNIFETGPTQKNYGVVFGVGAEIRLSSEVGISVNALSNDAYLGGLTIHWD